MRAFHDFGILQVRLCVIVSRPRRTLHYRAKPKNYDSIGKRLNELTHERPPWGWRRLLNMYERERIAVGEFRFRRIHRDLGLQVRPRKER